MGFVNFRNFTISSHDREEYNMYLIMFIILHYCYFNEHNI